MAKRRKSAIMIVLNGVINDSRVKKCASSLKNHGYDSRIYGLKKGVGGSPSSFKIDEEVEVTLFPDRRRNLPYGSHSGDKWRLLQLGLFSEMWPYIQKLKPDFIHSHDFGAIRLGHDLVERLRQEGNTSFWIHDLHEYVAGLEQMDEAVLEEALIDQRELIRRADRLITVSGPIARELSVDYDLSTPPVTIFNCPIYPGKLSKIGVKESLQLGKDSPLIVYAGGLAKQRGLENVISSLKTLRKHHLCIVADMRSKYISVLENLAKELKVKDRVHFVDYVEYSELPSFISDADIAIHPMLKYKNGDLAMPNKIFDYLHSELPIAVGNCETMSKFVERWKLGVSFESENISSLIYAIEYLTENTPNIDFETREYLAKRYSWKRQEEKLLTLYEGASKEMDLFQEISQDIEVSLIANGDSVEGNMGVDYFAGPFLLSLFENGEKKIEIETEKNGDFAFNIDSISTGSENCELEFKARRWGRIPLFKIKCEKKNRKWEVTKIPIK